MNPLELLTGRENEAPTDNYTPRFEGVAPFPLDAVYDRLRAAAVSGSITQDMSVYEAHAVFVGMFDEGISREELAVAEARLADRKQYNGTHLCRELTDAYARDYATNGLGREAFDAAMWTGALGLFPIGVVAGKATDKARETVAAGVERFREWNDDRADFGDVATGDTEVYSRSD